MTWTTDGTAHKNGISGEDEIREYIMKNKHLNESLGDIVEVKKMGGTKYKEDLQCISKDGSVVPLSVKTFQTTGKGTHDWYNSTSIVKKLLDINHSPGLAALKQWRDDELGSYKNTTISKEDSGPIKEQHKTQFDALSDTAMDEFSDSMIREMLRDCIKEYVERNIVILYNYSDSGAMKTYSMLDHDVYRYLNDKTVEFVFKKKDPSKVSTSRQICIKNKAGETICGNLRARLITNNGMGALLNGGVWSSASNKSSSLVIKIQQDSPHAMIGNIKHETFYKDVAYLAGDARELMKDVPDNSVSAIYFDPPFNTGKKYRLDTESELGFDDIFKNDQEYIKLIEPVLVEAKRVLKKDGSLFFHISAEEMLIPNFLCKKHFKHTSPIFWNRSRSKNNVKNKLGAAVDVLFWCSPSSKPKYNLVYQPLDPYYAENSYKNEDDRGNYALGHIVYTKTQKTTREDRYYKVIIADTHKENPTFNVEKSDILEQPTNEEESDILEQPTNEEIEEEKKNTMVFDPKNGWRVDREELERLFSEDRIHVPKKKGNLYRKIYKHESKGKPATNLWDDIHSIAMGSEGRKYPTQKPVALLERVILMSTEEGDTILDPMAGAGTTGVAALNLGRKAILFEENPEAIDIMKEKFDSK